MMKIIREMTAMIPAISQGEMGSPGFGVRRDDR